MRNLAKDAWPDSTRLLCVSGAQTPSTSIHREQDGLYTLQATTKTPAQPGRYTVFFRLGHGDQNTLFGDRVWIDVVVEAGHEEEEQKSERKPESERKAEPELKPENELQPAENELQPEPKQVADEETAVRRPEKHSLFEKEVEHLQDMGFCQQDPLLAIDLLRHARGNVGEVIEWFLVGKM